MTIQRLVHMANHVADFFRAHPKAETIESTANHLKSFWDPRMRRQIEAHLAEKAGAGTSHMKSLLAALARSLVSVWRVTHGAV